MRRKYIGKKLHFIGVGGISMSALMRIATKLGARTSGSDLAPSDAFRAPQNGFEKGVFFFLIGKDLKLCGIARKSFGKIRRLESPDPLH